MSNSPLNDKVGLVTYTLFVDGKKLNSDYDVNTLIIYNEINKPSACEIIFAVGDLINHENKISDSDNLNPGKKIKIELGYNSENVLVFEGNIISHNLILSSYDRFLKIVCKNDLLDLDSNVDHRIFTEKTDKQIAEELFKINKLSLSDNQLGTFKYSSVIKNNQSDLVFIKHRAILNGCFIVSDCNKISLNKPKYNGKPDVTLTFGKDIISLNLDLNSNDLIYEIKAVAWDLSNNKKIEVKKNCTASKRISKMDISKVFKDKNKKCYTLYLPEVDNSEVLNNWCESYLSLINLTAIQGEISFVGNSKIRTGELIELKEVGKKFNGVAFVNSVEHVYEDGKWITKLGIGLDPNSIRNANGLLNVFDNDDKYLQIGLVKKVVDDKYDNYKIEVELPFSESKSNSVLARVLTHSASNGFGYYNLPKIGDEVIVSFIGNNGAIVLGSVFSKKNKPDDEIQKNKNLISFSTSSKIKISIDDEKKIVSIKTPNENILLLDEEKKIIEISDQNKNSFKMSENGIEIISSKDIILKAEGAFDLNVGKNGTIASKSNLNIESNSTTVSSKSKSILKGSSGVDITSSGITTLKGSLVKIN